MHVNLGSKDKASPIVFAAGQGHELVFQLLMDTLENDQDYVELQLTQVQGIPGHAVMQAACEKGNMNIVKKLLATLDNPDPRKRVQVYDGKSMTHPVTQAVIYKHYEVAKLLLNLTDSNGVYIVDPQNCISLLGPVFRYGTDSNFLKYLLFERDLWPNKQGLFNQACSSTSPNAVENVKVLLTHPEVDINSQCVATGRLTPLMRACHKSSVEVVAFLLKTLTDETDETKIVKVNLRDNLNRTALHWACLGKSQGNKKLEVVKLLLETLELENVDRRIRLDLRDQTPINLAQKHLLKVLNPFLKMSRKEHIESDDRTSQEIVKLLKKYYQ